MSNGWGHQYRNDEGSLRVGTRDSRFNHQFAGISVLSNRPIDDY